jgi:hypothetical protein
MTLRNWLGHDQARADPALDGITIAPALHVAAHRLDDGECRLDYVGATERAAKLLGHPQFVNRECVRQAFLQTARRIGIEIH